ncbi:uncharacterized protein TNCV_719311 [Trichonephila clavipes]|nr:uncharacterized protein TNCV_719311 [Trichonephila clavipes]
MGATIPNIFQPDAFVWFEKTQESLGKGLPMRGWRLLKQLAVRVHFLRSGGLLDNCGKGVETSVNFDHGRVLISGQRPVVKFFRLSERLELSVMSRRKQRSVFAQVSEFDRGRILAYRDCGLSFREIGSHVGRNQITVMRICDRWMQERTTDGGGRSHPLQCTISREDRQIVCMQCRIVQSHHEL